MLQGEVFAIATFDFFIDGQSLIQRAAVFHLAVFYNVSNYLQVFTTCTPFLMYFFLN